MDDGHARRHALELPLDALATLLQHELELCSFASSRRGEVAEGLLEQRHRFFRQRLRAERGFGEHAGPAENLDDRQRRAFRSVAQHLARGIAKLRDARGVDGELRRTGRRPRQRQSAVDLAALQLRREDVPDGGFDRPQLIGQTNLDVEIAMVHRSQLDGERTTGQLCGDRRKARHAQYHSVVVSGVRSVRPGETCRARVVHACPMKSLLYRRGCRECRAYPIHTQV